MKLFLNKLIYLKNNKSFSNVKQLTSKTKNLDLYEYFKLPLEKRIKYENEEINLDFDLDLYKYFKLSPEERKNYLIKK